MRGAYLYLERDRAAAKGYPSPILDTIQQTHDNYNRWVPVPHHKFDFASIVLSLELCTCLVRDTQLKAQRKDAHVWRIYSSSVGRSQ